MIAKTSTTNAPAIFQIEENNIYQGDSIALIAKVESESVHLILSDIPYGIGADG